MWFWSNNHLTITEEELAIINYTQFLIFLPLKFSKNKIGLFIGSKIWNFHSTFQIKLVHTTITYLSKNL